MLNSYYSNNIYGPKWSWAEMVIGRNGNRPKQPGTIPVCHSNFFLPKADTCISHNRALTRVLKTGVNNSSLEKLESKR